MSDLSKTGRVSDQELASHPYASSAEGQVLDAKQTFLQRLHSLIKLDNSDAKPEHGRWSNAGKYIKLRECEATWF